MQILVPLSAHYRAWFNTKTSLIQQNIGFIIEKFYNSSHELLPFVVNLL